ncbi:MAG: hypothetical protein LBR26_17275 [Prevotella sp.]|jgi:hypothetical protein|nr:hypothetical protein [Prevotella sp.]
MKKLSIFLLIAFATLRFSAYAQENLEGNREQLLSVYKDVKRLKNIEKLQKTLAKGPAKSELSNVDGLAGDATVILTETLAINELLPNLYTRSIGQTIDGVTEVNVKKPTVEELLEVSTRIALNVKATTDATSKLSGAGDEVKGVKNPMKAKKALNIINYTKDALSFSADELVLQGKLINSLIETIKTSDNL